MELKINDNGFEFELAKKSNGEFIFFIKVVDVEDGAELMIISLYLDELEFKQLQKLVE